MKKIILFILTTYSTVCYSQDKTHSIDENIPAISLTDTSCLTVLNARYGSRFSFSYASKDYGIHTGALGYDFDELNELFIEVESNGKSYCLRTANKPEGTTYLVNQQLKVGMASMQISGETNEGQKIILTIVSPFTPSESLDDTINLKKQIVPAYFVIVDIQNNSAAKFNGKLRVGFRKIPVGKKRVTAIPFGRNVAGNVIHFKDNASLGTKTALAGLGKQHSSFRKQGFSGLEISVNANKNKTFSDTVIYATHYAEKVQSDNKYNMALRFYYNKFWKNLAQVLEYSHSNAKKLINLSEKFENILNRSKCTPEEKWVIATTFRSDIANTFLLLDDENKARFYLSEGQFKHQSTIDVAHETELMAIFSPWRLKLQLEQWMDYMARKEVEVGIKWNGEKHLEGMSASEYGPFLYHDVGDLPNVSKTSDYSFGPQMAVEENTDYVLLMYWYWKLTGDDEFVKSHLGMIDILLYSLMNRDTNNNGIADRGVGWSTYDNENVIKRSPDNTYLGVKQMCAYEVAADMFANLASKAKQKIEEDKKNVVDGTGIGFEHAQLNNEILRNKQAKKYRAEAAKIASVLNKAYKKYKFIPASLDKTFEGWNVHSVVIGEGLFLPGLSGLQSKTLKSLIPAISATYASAFEKSKRSNGIALSTISHSTWFSKVMVSDIVAHYWFNKNVSTAHFAYAWNINNYFAYNDGINEDGKTAWIGFWYPRGVSSLGYLFKEKNFKSNQKNDFLEGLK